MENLGDVLKRLATTRHSSEDGYGRPDEGVADGTSDSCEVCGGRGWFTPPVPAGHTAFGQIMTCRCLEDRLAEEQSARLLRYSNLGHLARFTFGTLDPTGRGSVPENQRLFQEAYDAGVAYAANPTGWLAFTGPHGSGKTHLATAIANRCIESGSPAFFVHVPDLLDHLRASFSPTSDISYTDLFEQVGNSPLLVLDGLGNQEGTSWAQEKLRQIFNHRYNAQLSTVVTTACELRELDPYILSRLQTYVPGRILEVAKLDPGPVHDLGGIAAEMVRRMTFEGFDSRGNNPTASQRDSLEGAYQAAKNFAADPDGWLTLFGDTGVGKTHLAVAIAVERKIKAQPVFFAFVPELLDYLRYTYTPESRITYDRVLDEVKNTPLLILDDLGQEHSSPWAAEKLYQIIVHRHNARLPTVITSTLDFAEQTGPISSRVRDPSVSWLVRVDAPDYRIKKRVAGTGGGRGQSRDARG